MGPLPSAQLPPVLALFQASPARPHPRELQLEPAHARVSEPPPTTPWRRNPYGYLRLPAQSAVRCLRLSAGPAQLFAQREEQSLAHRPLGASRVRLHQALMVGLRAVTTALHLSPEHQARVAGAVT